MSLCSLRRANQASSFIKSLESNWTFAVDGGELLGEPFAWKVVGITESLKASASLRTSQTKALRETEDLLPSSKG